MFRKAFFAIVVSIVAIALLAGVSVYFNRYQLAQNYLETPPYSHKIGHNKSFMLPMQDGVKLHTNLMLPEGNGPWPAILIRNPYDTQGSDIFNFFCGIFTQYGYACVYQEARGQMRSEGEWVPVYNEAQDGTDTLNWMKEQSWMDGNMAMWGISYLALTQWAGAMEYPEELKTFIPISMGTDFHRTLYEKGMFRPFVTLWILLMPDRGINVEGVFKFMEAAKHFPHNEVDEKFAGKKLEWYQQWIEGASVNAPVWQRDDALALSELTSKLDIPLLMFDGWYDPFFASQLEDYQTLASREQSRMVVGPWGHIQRSLNSLPVSDDAVDAGPREIRASIEWLDHHLKGQALSEAAYIETYDIGSKQWKKRQSWPPATEMQHFELANFSESNACSGAQLLALSDTAMQILKEDATIFIEELADREKSSFYYDPNDPVMSRGGSGFLGPVTADIRPGSLLQDTYCERDDVLTFTSSPLDEDMTIAGNMMLKMMVSSDAEDTAFTAKILDVQPNGQAVNIRDSITTLSFRNDAKDPLVYTPNAIVEVTIDMWPMEWTLKAGHRLRLDVSSSNFPAYILHSNYAGPWAGQERVKTAKQTIYAPSFLSLPIIVKEEAVSGETLTDDEPDQELNLDTDSEDDLEWLRSKLSS